MSAVEIIVTYIFPSILVLALIIGFWLFYFQNKDFSEQKWSEEIAATKPYTDIKKSYADIFKENFRILAWYLLFFVLIIPLLVHFFGKIKYGPNMPYISFLIIVGIPFLIAFAHILTNVDHQRNRLIASGLSRDEASTNVSKWMALAPIAMIFVIYIILKLANAIM
jgi:hypothetical protein